MEENTSFYNAKQFAEIAGISESKAYRVIAMLNQELEKKGFITFRGRVNRHYFDERVFGKELSHASLQR